MEKQKIILQIAIDGPVAAGKGDIAGRLASMFRLIYINTGAMYRMLALACIEKQINMKDGKKVFDVFSSSSIELAPPQKDRSTFTAILNGKDVTERILDPDVSQGASDVAVYPEVRKKMVMLQKELAAGKRVVMEGRDIGLRVLPDASLKIFLTADVEERAHRRWLQWQEKGIQKSLEEVIEETRIRDKQDSGRATDPLVQLPDAWRLDTTGKNQDEIVFEIQKELLKRGLL